MNATTAKPMPETIELEAHAVYKNIGLTPRQLADQRAELLAALKPFANLRLGPNGYCSDMLAELVADARTAVARAKAVPK